MVEGKKPERKQAPKVERNILLDGVTIEKVALRKKAIPEKSSEKAKKDERKNQQAKAGMGLSATGCAKITA